MTASPKTRTKAGSKASRKTTLRTKKSNSDKKRSQKSKYEITKEIDVKRLKEPDVYPYKKQNILHRKFVEEYKDFFEFFRKSSGFLKGEIYRELITSHEFRNHYDHITAMMKSFDESKVREGTKAQQYEALSIMTDYAQFTIWYDKLINDLPQKFRGPIIELLGPNIKLVKSIIEILKEVNPELKNMRVYSSDLENNELHDRI